MFRIPPQDEKRLCQWAVPLSRASVARRLVGRLQILFPFGAPSAEGLAPHIVLGAMLGALAARVQDRSPRPALSFADLSAALERASAAPSAAAHQPTAWQEALAAQPKADAAGQAEPVDAADLSAVVETARQRWQQAPPTAAVKEHETEPPWKRLSRKRKHPSAEEEPLTIPHAHTPARGAPPCKVRVKEEEVEPAAQARLEEGGEEGVKGATAEDHSAADGLSEDQFRTLMETLLGHGLPAVLDEHHGLK